MRRLSIIFVLFALVLVACSSGTTPVVSMSPGEGAIDVALDASITATLRDPVDPNRTDELIALYREDGQPVDGAVAYDAGTRTVVFDPTDELEPGSTYTVVVMPASMSTAANQGTGQEQRWSFTTTPGMVITGTNPADGATEVPADTLVTIDFRNTVDEQQLRDRFALTTPAGAVVPGVLVYDSVTKRATFTPDERLESATLYTAIIKPKETGSTSKGFSWSFTTGEDIIRLETHQAAAVVLGRINQAYGYYPGGLGDDSFSDPAGNPVSSDGALYLPDRGNNRLLVYYTTPDTDAEPADAVIGQPDFNTGTPGSGAGDFDASASAALADDRLVVADRDNNRVLIWSGLPSSHQDAVTVVGQSAFGESASGCAADRLNAPESAFVVDGRLIVADAGNHRVLVWNELPSQSGLPADLVLGQPSFGECTANRGGPVAATTLNQPHDAWSDGQRLLVADKGNNRVLVWETFPVGSSDEPSLVVGQADFLSNGSGVGAQRLSAPRYLAASGGQLFVADTGNNRVLVWNEFPVQNSTPADVVLGQGDFECNIDNSYYDESTGSCDYFDPDFQHRATHQTMYAPAGLHLLAGALLVADGGNNRYMIFESLP